MSKKVKILIAALSVLLVVGLCSSLFIRQPERVVPPYTFLNGAKKAETLLVPVKYGGLKRVYFLIDKPTEQVIKEIEKELGSTVSRNGFLGQVQDGEIGIMIIPGKAPTVSGKWDGSETPMKEKFGRFSAMVTGSDLNDKRTSVFVFLPSNRPADSFLSRINRLFGDRF